MVHCVAIFLYNSLPSHVSKYTWTVVVLLNKLLIDDSCSCTYVSGHQLASSPAYYIYIFVRSDMMGGVRRGTRKQIFWSKHWSSIDREPFVAIVLVHRPHRPSRVGIYIGCWRRGYSLEAWTTSSSLVGGVPAGRHDSVSMSSGMHIYGRRQQHVERAQAAACTVVGGCPASCSTKKKFIKNGLDTSILIWDSIYHAKVRQKKGHSETEHSFVGALAAQCDCCPITWHTSSREQPHIYAAIPCTYAMTCWREVRVSYYWEATEKFISHGRNKASTRSWLVRYVPNIYGGTAGGRTWGAWIEMLCYIRGYYTYCNRDSHARELSNGSRASSQPSSGF
jgi:hypothetical protein